ncbi:CcmD family protein [Mucilaginibacter sp. PPCGB 2223]|uniref:CcmD family protein n=1 Tax=Mucilaginibacter sp. PPCGB 2223 TaxID=1886027 RepID=UPI0008259824|nr:CcmD family protein [Mucilaginibacter sp. PPCGB 2223]OCX53695.1 CcmD family protein [Mucilaginibacter sp. PPCGB 2223]
MKKLSSIILFLLIFTTVFAQQSAGVEMADTLRSSGKIYVVITTIAIVFIGIIIYLFSIDRRLKKLEK